MATTLNTEHKAARGDVHILHWKDIMVDFSKNRRTVPVTEEEIKTLALSILKYKQKQACIGRRIMEKESPDYQKVVLVAGFSRWRAIDFINTTIQPDNPIPVKVVLQDGNEEDADITNIIENLNRSVTDVLDDAYNQQYLREVRGHTETQIAELFHCSQSWVSKLRGMLTLTSQVKKAIIERKLDGSVALANIVGLAESEQNSVLDKLLTEAPKATIGARPVFPTTPTLPGMEGGELVGAAAPAGATGRGGKAVGTTGKNGKLRSSAVRAAVREVKHTSGKKGPGRTKKDIVDFFIGIGSAVNEDVSIKTFCSKFEKFCADAISDKVMENAIFDLLEAKPEKKKKTAPAK
jgi:ParB/RepB/Spo0J family partition protein